MAVVARNNGDLQLTDEERAKTKEFGKDLAGRTGLVVVTYPLSFAKVLFQLGHEPYPLTEGKSLFFFGRHSYFLPNVLKYISNIVQDQGLKTLFTGFDAAIAALVVGGTASFATQLYIDRYFPSLGGDPLEDKEEHEIDDHYSAQLQVRKAVRKTVSQLVGTIISRPFTVIMVRRIAQEITGENKYTNFICSFFKIGREEGPRGLFSGLLPALIADIITIWGVTAIRYGVERVLIRTGIDDTNDAEQKERAKEGRFLLNYVVPFIVAGFSYPYQVVSTVMALTGSGLAVSLLPYSPLFPNWLDAFDYMKANRATTRGARLFVREYKEAVSIGSDGKYYALTKHYV
jgi:carrier protein